MRTPPNQLQAFNMPLPMTKDTSAESNFKQLLEKYTLSNAEPEWKTEQKNSLEQLN